MKELRRASMTEETEKKTEETVKKFVKKEKKASKEEAPKAGLVVDVSKANLSSSIGKKASDKKLTTKAKKTEKKKSESGRAGRPSPFVGKKIKTVAKEHGAREGTLRAALMKKIMAASNVDDVIGKTVSAGDKSKIVASADIHFAVKNNLIQVY